MVMVTLTCAIVGVPGSAFPVDIDEKKLVGHLKEAIKGKNDDIECPARKLQLFLAKTAAGAWLESDSEDVKMLKKGEKTAAVEALTSEEKELQGESGLQKVLLDGMPTPSTDQIHVLVVVPESTGGATTMQFDQVKMASKLGAQEALVEEGKKKRSVYSFSKLNTEREDTMKKKMRLTDKYVVVCEQDPSEEEAIPPYVWLEDIAEGADPQRQQYMAYLRHHFMINKGLFWLDGTPNKDMLSHVDPRLPFELKGTTNVLLVDERSVQHELPLAGVRMVVELKKKVEPHHRPQLFGELVSASLKAPDCVIGLLTDLKDHWFFSWFNDKKVLMHIRITHPKNAFDFIAAAVAEPESSKPFSVPFVSETLTKFKIDDFLPMPDDGADEMMERYELMADVVEPEFLMERRMEYARQLVQSMPMYSYMYT